MSVLKIRENYSIRENTGGKQQSTHHFLLVYLSVFPITQTHVWFLTQCTTYEKL